MTKTKVTGKNIRVTNETYQMISNIAKEKHRPLASIVTELVVNYMEEQRRIFNPNVLTSTLNNIPQERAIIISGNNLDAYIDNKLNEKIKEIKTNAISQ